LKYTVVVSPKIQAVIEDLSPRDQSELIEKLEFLEVFPRMYAMQLKGRFRRHRKFVAGNWAVYYRVVENTVYIRGLWPARLPLKLLGRR
jgi:mRNA-degrading endonuclease RelE of RelBE toxin-antitoxin system